MKSNYIETEFIKKCDKRKSSLDLSSVNMFEAAKIMALVSAHHYKNFPDGKVICKSRNNELSDIASLFSFKNLEVINL